VGVLVESLFLCHPVDMAVYVCGRMTMSVWSRWLRVQVGQLRSLHSVMSLS